MRPEPLVLLQALSNRVLRLDEQALSELSRLSGKYILIQIVDPPLSFCLAPGAEGIRLVDADEVRADALVRCRWLDFLPLLCAREGALPEGVTISGDMHLLHELRGICARFSPDWQEPVSRVVGDTATYYLERLLARTGRRLRRSSRQLLLDLGEYLQYEKRLVPDAGELDAFYRAVDGLRSDVDRQEKRLQALLSATQGSDT